jgi:hypothetical protein
MNGLSFTRILILKFISGKITLHAEDKMSFSYKSARNYISLLGRILDQEMENR